MNKIKFPVLLIICVLLGAVRAFPEDMLMNQAVKKYLQGNYSSAITDFEKVLENEENEKASQLLYKSLIAESEKLYEQKNYPAAAVLAEKASALKPGDPAAEELTKKISSKTKPKKTVEDVKFTKLETDIKAERNKSASYRSKYNAAVAAKKKLEKEVADHKEELNMAKNRIDSMSRSSKLMNVILIAVICLVLLAAAVLAVLLIKSVSALNEAMAENQNQLTEIEDRFGKRMENNEENTEALEERVARSINKMIDSQKDIVKQLSMSAAGKTQVDIEDIKDRMTMHFEMQQEKLLELLNQQARAISSEKTEVIELSDRIITDVNPHVRARADSVELIPKTISDPNVAEKVLRPYLEDPNNRVRANACVAIYQYNPELAMKTLDKMTQSPDKWFRLSAAWALGVVASHESPKILRKLLDDVDERVKDRALRAFENFAGSKEDISEEIRRMIDESKGS